MWRRRLPVVALVGLDTYFNEQRSVQCSKAQVPILRDIIVIGAGASGIAAATTLKNATQADILVLEGRSRIGGRICTSEIWNNLAAKVPSGYDDVAQDERNLPRWIELGAHWIHGLTSDNPIYNLAQSRGIRLHRTSCDDEPSGDVRLFDPVTNKWVDKTLYEKNVQTYAHIRDFMDQQWKRKGEGTAAGMHRTLDTTPSEPDQAASTKCRNPDIAVGEFFDSAWASWAQVQKLSSAATDGESSSLLKRVFNWCKDRVSIACACELDELSTSVWMEQADDGEEGEGLLMEQGYFSLFRDLAATLDIRLNQVVDSVRIIAPEQLPFSHQSSQALQSDIAADYAIEIRTTDGQVYRCKHAVCTLPLGVLQAGRVTFAPPLPPWKQAALRNMNSGVLNIVALKFDRPFWDEMDLGDGGSEGGPATKVINFFGLARTDSDAAHFSTWVNLHPSRVDKAPILMAQVVQPFATELEGMDEKEIAALAMQSLRKMFAAALPRVNPSPSPSSTPTSPTIAAVTTIPDPVGCVVSRWCGDPFALGSYSYAPLGSSMQDFAAIAAPLSFRGIRRIFFAGEHTFGSASGTVHGAWKSGFIAAAALLEEIGHSKDERRSRKLRK